MKIKRNWKKAQATSLPHAMELCLEYAKQKHNRGVERIAECMGLTNKWMIYKWIEGGNIPANLIPAFEFASGINFITRWLAHTNNQMLIRIPLGNQVSQSDSTELHQDFSDAYTLLINFYEGKSDKEETLFALTRTMEQIAWHRENVKKHHHPELDFEASNG